MTEQEFYIIVGYLCNPDRNTHIEIEMHPNSRIQFEELYRISTNDYPLPKTSSVAPYYIWNEDANKWGRQSRVYFTSNVNIPEVLLNILEPNVRNTRPGNDLIDRLFGVGFIIGSPQITDRIQNFIPHQYSNDYNTGFNL